MYEEDFEKEDKKGIPAIKGMPQARDMKKMPQSNPADRKRGAMQRAMRGSY
jgi:hypothetical protein